MVIDTAKPSNIREISHSSCMEEVVDSKSELILDWHRGMVQVRKKNYTQTMGSYLGFIWLFLDPLIMTLVYLFVFTVISYNEAAEGIERSEFDNKTENSGDCDFNPCQTTHRHPMHGLWNLDSPVRTGCQPPRCSGIHPSYADEQFILALYWPVSPKCDYLDPGCPQISIIFWDGDVLRKSCIVHVF